MLNKSYISSKLSEFLFLKLSDNVINDVFGCYIQDEIYFPIKSSEIIEPIKSNNSVDEIPMKDFIEGMFYVIGCDEHFLYSNIYMDILGKNHWCVDIIKGIIAKYIKQEKELDVYLLLRGLYIIENNVDNYDKLLWCVFNIKAKNERLYDEFKNIIDHGKENKYCSAFLYESLGYNDDSKYEEAYNSLNLFYSLGGKDNSEIVKYRDELKLLSDFEKGKNNASSNPKYALELLLPLVDEFEDNAFIYLYIAVAYRNIGMSEKAIYYLNEAKTIDEDLLDIYNELGLNYACLNNYDSAITYFKKIFETTRSVEVCTNIVMCYLNKGDIKNAKMHLEIAKKIDGKDEIVKQLDEKLGEVGER